MRAVAIDAFKTPGTLRDVEPPGVGPNDVLVRITVAGMNPVDWKTRAGEAGDKPMPLTLGQDFAGVVERTGAAFVRLAPGDRVFGIAREHGSYAERTVVTDATQGSPIAKTPDGLSDTLAAAIPTAALTALAALEALGIGLATPVLVIGAAGAVGAAVLQLARDRGAVATALVKPGQAADARRFGAATVIEHDGDGMHAAIRAAHPEPFDAICDLVSGADGFAQNAELLVAGGKALTTVHVADEAAYRARGLAAINLALAKTPESSPSGLERLAAMVVAGSLTIDVAAERPFSEAVATLDAIERGELAGKYVLRVAGE